MAKLQKSAHADDAPLEYGTDVAPDGASIDQGLLQDFMGMYLRRAYEVAYEDFRRRLGKDAMQPGYFTILTLIVRNPRISQTQIGAASARDKSSVTKALRAMEDAGLIQRLRSGSDRRIHLSVATEEGIAMQKQMEIKAADHVKALHDAIGPDRYEAFLTTMKDMIRTLEETAVAKDAKL
ncbi:MarR family winged helix-turn-helix transcriptional regulator [Neptunicoccus sediminis]|uniref:MarR family winged helix-turn-helix transcriptional regulator n=1 Tax=Neptunicoccus sediminis TaxID=1892596 RepID=UPI0009F1E256|nr:MarR family transcriptional regulator [Neptunicoccus sediminis]